MIIDPAIEVITIGGGSPSSVYYTAVLEMTLTGTTTAITKATASLGAADAATTSVATAELTSLDFEGGVETVSSTTTRTVTVAFASSHETLPLPAASS